MKKLVIVLICIILFMFVNMCIIILIDRSYINDIVYKISKNTGVDDIVYVNEYNDYYIFKDNKYLYLLDFKYDEICRIQLDLIYENKNNYEIIYRDNIMMYMDNYVDDVGIMFKYYDIYTYELIDEVVFGGS